MWRLRKGAEALRSGAHPQGSRRRANRIRVDGERLRLGETQPLGQARGEEDRAVPITPEDRPPRLERLGNGVLRRLGEVQDGGAIGGKIETAPPVVRGMYGAEKGLPAAVVGSHGDEGR